MPVHDWTRLEAGIFHDFHNVWIGQLRNALNEGLLPEGYYAMSEQHAGRYVADVLTLQTDPAQTPAVRAPTGLAVAEAPPKVRHQFSLSEAARSRRKTLAVRHVSGHRLVALIEIVSPANKDRHEHVQEFLNKAEDALHYGVHLLVVDLFPPGAHDPQGMHGALWDRLGDTPPQLLPGGPVTLSAYVADTPVKAYVEHVAFGQVLPDMPLFLDPDYYINVPLERTYQSTWRGTPEPWRRLLEGKTEC
jgi:hypothetical protein